MIKVVIGIGIAILIGAVVIFAASSTTDAPVSPNNQQQAQENTQTDATFTAQDVASHNTANDCWTIISGVVYDITRYIPVHPGGDEILRACGADGTTMFETRTTEDGETVGSGTPHSRDASSMLAQFKVGTLAD